MRTSFAEPETTGEQAAIPVASQGTNPILSNRAPKTMGGNGTPRPSPTIEQRDFISTGTVAALAPNAGNQRKIGEPIAI
jgi:hypothetical protein